MPRLATVIWSTDGGTKGGIYQGALKIGNLERQFIKYFLFCISIVFLISTVLLLYEEIYTLKINY